MRTLLLAASWLCLIPALAPAAPDRVADASSGQVPSAGDLVLFPLDDVSIPWRDNLKLTLQVPKRYPGNPVMRLGPSEAPDGDGALGYGTVIKQDGKFRQWYIATPRALPPRPGETDLGAMGSQSPRPIAYAESADGIHWTRPDLGLVDFRGSKHNNLISIEPAAEPYARAHDFVAVLYEPGDPDVNARYKMAYIVYDQPTGHFPSTATAVSPDGLRWKLVNTATFNHGKFENSSLIKFDGLYYTAGQAILPDGALADGSPAGRVMKVFYSPDFHHWSNGRAIAFYRSDYLPRERNFGEEVHMGAGLWNRGNIVLGLYGRWHGPTIHREASHPNTPLNGLKIDLGFVVSNDATHYREPVRNFVMVPHSTSDADWDSEAMLQSNAFANTATETYIWYSAWDTSQSDIVPPLPAPLTPRMIQKAYGIGLLTLPRDRFGSFSKLLAVSQERNPASDVKRDASCLTRVLRLKQPSLLSVNVDEVSPASPLQIALVDDAERPLEGYTAQLTTASLKAGVVWSGGRTDLPVNTPFRVKITWPVEGNGGQLYAIYIEQK